MKYQWEEADIIPGRRIAPSNGAEERWMISYVAGGEENRYCMTSLADGAVVAMNSTKAMLASNLNASKYNPTDIR